MTENEVHRIIHQAFIDGWNPTGPEVPFVFDNERFDAREPDEFVRVIVRPVPGGQTTLGPVGGRVYRRRGAVLIEVYSPVDRGLLRLDELTRAARDIYEGKTISLVMFNDGNTVSLPPNGRWARGNVLVSFTYDETK